ncbi:MAG: hypothetical protein K2N34_10600 [Lachnospiraceae bacterium]|nr:hypothetical protein [Lachnospiraceae bacterium]
MKKMNRKKIGKSIMTMALVGAMAVGTATGVKMTVENSYADELRQFDPVFYAQAYPDVVAVLGADAETLYNHYQNFGQKEGRIPYAGAMAGEVVDGIAGADAVTQVTEQTPTIDMNKTYYTLLGDPMSGAEFLQRQQQMQQNFDATGYVHTGWTEAQVQERLLSLKEKYPDGTVVGICSQGAARIINDLYGGMINTVVGTDGDDNWTDVEGRVYFETGLRHNADIRNIRVGDELHTYGSGAGHVSVVLSKSDKGITVVESNWGGDKKMHWGRFIPWSDLESDNSSSHNFWILFHHYLY